MKTKAQKKEIVEKAKVMLQQTRALIFLDLGKIGADEIRELRQELKKSKSQLLVIKKRLLGLIFGDLNVVFGEKSYKTPMGTVFVTELESAAATVRRFFRRLEMEKKSDSKKILGGMAIAEKNILTAARIIAIGDLPPREVLLGQLVGTIAAPLKSLLFVLQEAAKRS